MATLLLTAGGDLYTVGKLLGHTNINTTQVYADVLMETKIDAVNRISEFFQTNRYKLMTLTSAHTQRTTFAFFEQLVKMRCVLKVQSVSNLIDGLVGGRKFHLCLHHQLAADVA